MPLDERWTGLGKAAEHLNLNDIEFREYQYNIAKKTFNGENTMIILPTGLGKTLIAAIAIANSLANNTRAIILAPTKPLATQHYESMQRLLNTNPDDIVLLTGTSSKKSRSESEANAKVIIATPQTIANDLKKQLFTLPGFGIVVFDECHRAVGKYAYTYVANEATETGVQVIGLTASPGSRKDRVNELLTSLNINAIEIRTSFDEDVAKYVMQKNTHWVLVEKSSEIERVTAALKPVIEENFKGLYGLGLLPFKKFEIIPKGRLIEIGRHIDRIQAKNYKFAALAFYIKLLNGIHAYDLIETEGFGPFLYYFESLRNREKIGRSVEAFMHNVNVLRACKIAEETVKAGMEHPKLGALLNLIHSHSDNSFIVFAQYRSTVNMIVNKLKEHGITAEALVGKKQGVTQAKQQEVVSGFRDKKFKVLVASSVGEEGLDIPSVDMVVFYEPIASEIRSIQRRGRTGRFYTGEIYLLVTKDTKDQVYLFVSQRKEKKMLELMMKVKADLEKKNNKRDFSNRQKKL